MQLSHTWSRTIAHFTQNRESGRYISTRKSLTAGVLRALRKTKLMTCRLALFKKLYVVHPAHSELKKRHLGMSTFIHIPEGLHSFHISPRATSKNNPVTVLLKRLVRDLQKWLNCSWAAGLSSGRIRTNSRTAGSLCRGGCPTSGDSGSHLPDSGQHQFGSGCHHCSRTEERRRALFRR